MNDDQGREISRALISHRARLAATLREFSTTIAAQLGEIADAVERGSTVAAGVALANLEGALSDARRALVGIGGMGAAVCEHENRKN